MSGRTNHLQTKGIFIDEDARRRPSSLETGSAAKTLPSRI